MTASLTDRRWRKARNPDRMVLAAWLAAEESYCVNLVSRLKRRNRIDLPTSRLDELYINRDVTAVNGVVLRASGGLYLPFGIENTGRGQLSTLLSEYRSYPHSGMGLERDVRALTASLGIAVPNRVDYHLMREESPGLALSASQALLPPGTHVRQARMRDYELLLPLQTGYEEEEVLLPGRSLNTRQVTLNLKRMLDEQLVALVEMDGRVVAKANTNARGLSHGQIGGVYTLPAYRSMGLGRSVVRKVMDLLSAEDKTAVLFVKRHNEAAHRAYRALGFHTIDDFSIAYYR